MVVLQPATTNLLHTTLLPADQQRMLVCAAFSSSAHQHKQRWKNPFFVDNSLKSQFQNLSFIISTSLANEEEYSPIEPAPIIHQPLQKINSEPVKHWRCNTIFCLDQIKYKIYLALDKQRRAVKCEHGLGTICGDEVLGKSSNNILCYCPHNCLNIGTGAGSGKRNCKIKISTEKRTKILHMLPRVAVSTVWPSVKLCSGG